MLLLISPKAIQAQQPVKLKELGIIAKRCNYYYSMFKLGDPNTRYILLSKDPEAGNITGFEKCFQALDDYLANPDISSDERRVYENLRDHLSLIIEQLPRD
jgi:hypothetical protein